MKWKNSLKDGLPEDQQKKCLVRQKQSDGYEYWVCEKDRDFQMLVSGEYTALSAYDDFDWIAIEEIENAVEE